jgi:membrane dipeptidase
VAANGGIVMVTFVPGFIAPEAGRQYPQLAALTKKYAGDPEGLRKARAEFRKTTPEPKATLAMVADHIDHIRKVAGIDHIGLGGDFDGIDSVVEGLEDVSKYPDLTAELLRRGYSDEDLRKILGKNILRVMRKAEGVARTLASTPPSVAVVK